MVWEYGSVGVWEGFPKIEDGGSKIALCTAELESGENAFSCHPERSEGSVLNATVEVLPRWVNK